MMRTMSICDVTMAHVVIDSRLRLWLVVSPCRAERLARRPPASRGGSLDGGVRQATLCCAPRRTDCCMVIDHCSAGHCACHVAEQRLLRLVGWWDFVLRAGPEVVGVDAASF